MPVESGVVIKSGVCGARKKKPTKLPANRHDRSLQQSTPANPRRAPAKQTPAVDLLALLFRRIRRKGYQYHNGTFDVHFCSYADFVFNPPTLIMKLQLHLPGTQRTVLCTPKWLIPEASRLQPIHLVAPSQAWVNAFFPQPSLLLLVVSCGHNFFDDS